MKGSYIFIWENSIVGRWKSLCKGFQESVRLVFREELGWKNVWSGVNEVWSE